MKTLILYASKYGAAKETARRIADKMGGDALVCDLKQNNIPPLSGFDCVIIGSSVYAGSLRSEAKAFAAKHADELCTKTLGLYISGFSEDEGYFAKNYPSKVVQSAKATAFPGGIFDPKKANVIERLIIKIIMKSAEYADKIDDEKISEFAVRMRK